MENTIMKEEKLHLSSVLDKLRVSKEKLETAMQALGSNNVEQLRSLRDDNVTDPHDFMMFVQQLHEQNESFNIKDKVKRVEEVEYLLKEPYFSRLDISDPKDATDSQQLYIGKFGYTEDKPVIIDWRAKVASIYYRYRYPQKGVKYDTPEGEVTKDLNLKRTFEFDEGELVKFYNNDLQLDEDEIIAGKIEERTGGVLEDIIETIQEGQLDIIESDPRKICIVQGCVGSGKSTVAIHKMSHIFFNYPALVQPERAILIAKSGVLVSYLATLFPKLGIFDVNYKTLSELLVNLIFREDLGLKFDMHKDQGLADVTTADVTKLQKELHEIHETYDEKIQKILDDDIFASLSSFVYSYDHSVLENITELITDLKEELQYQKERYKDNPKSVKAWIFKENIDNLRKLITKVNALKKHAKEKDFPKLLKEWGIDTSVEVGYKEALLYVYVHYNLFGYSKSLKYQYCVVDEGQDFSVLEYLVLGTLVQHGRFCILGDLNQSYLEEGLDEWELIQQAIGEAKQAEVFELDTNYRSTKQIIKFANKILSPYTQNYLPKSIDREGPEPVVRDMSKINDVSSELESELRDDLKSLDKSIGVICFNDEMHTMANNILTSLSAELEIPAEKVVRLHDQKRISYIPQGVYLSMFEDCKGLEFSKVYVLGMSLDDVSTFNEAKKAFVATTRAMNELVVYSL